VQAVKMPNITLSIPQELKQKMEELPELNWSERIREFLSEKVKRALLLKKLDKMLENSELTEEDCLRLGKKAKKGIYERLKKKGMV
jgi:hypothetical protein